MQIPVALNVDILPKKDTAIRCYADSLELHIKVWSTFIALTNADHHARSELHRGTLRGVLTNDDIPLFEFGSGDESGLAERIVGEQYLCFGKIFCLVND